MEVLLSGGLLNKQERRSTSKQAIISADQNTVWIYWFLIKLQNFIRTIFKAYLINSLRFSEV